MPTKIIKPVDSLISLSSTIIEILKENSMNIDDLLLEFNARYYKKITIEKLILCLDFLFIIDKIKDEHETIAISI
jgi:hypothetical protein